MDEDYDDDGDDDGEVCPDCGGPLVCDDADEGWCPVCLTDWRIGLVDEDRGEDLEDEDSEEGAA